MPVVVCEERPTSHWKYKGVLARIQAIVASSRASMGVLTSKRQRGTSQLENSMSVDSRRKNQEQV